MPDYALLEQLLLGTKQNIANTESLTEDKISENAVSYIKNKVIVKKLFDIFIINRESKKEAVFTAGLSGVGKSEFVEKLNEDGTKNIINPDEIRKLMPGYSGANSSLYQHASAIGVNKLLDETFAKSLSFVLDTNFSDTKIALANVERALRKEYAVVIYYIHRPVEKALKMAKTREDVEGRKVPINIFIDKGLGSIKTFLDVLENYKGDENVSFVLLDIENERVITGGDITKQFQEITSENTEKLLTMKIAVQAPEGGNLDDAVISINSNVSKSLDIK